MGGYINFVDDFISDIHQNTLEDGQLTVVSKDVYFERII